MLLLQYEHMLCRLEHGRSLTNVLFKTYPSKSCAYKKVFIHKRSAYCSDYIFVGCVKHEILVSSSAIMSSIACVPNRCLRICLCNVRIRSFTLLNDDFAFKEKDAVRAPAAVLFIRNCTDYIATPSGTPFVSQTILDGCKIPITDIRSICSNKCDFIWTWRLDAHFTTCLATFSP